MEDQQILKLLRQGKHSKALDKLYKNFPAIRKLILNKGGSEDDARDIFQEALIIFCEKAENPQFQLTSAIGTYLYSVSRFLWKAAKNKEDRYVALGDWDISIPQEELHHHVEEEKRFRFLDQILQDLGERCRELFELFYFQKLSVASITARLGYSTEDSAKNQKYKCMERAKKMAQEHLTKNIEA